MEVAVIASPAVLLPKSCSAALDDAYASRYGSPPRVQQQQQQQQQGSGPSPSAPRQPSPSIAATDATSVAEIAASCVPGWAGCAIRATALTGGTTNAVWKCALESEDEDGMAVLVRVYGPHTDILINRPLELKLCSFLGQFGLTPPVYGAFSNGFVLGYVPGRTLRFTDMTAYHAEIARAVARWHSFDATPVLGVREPCLWPLMHRWLAAASVPASAGPALPPGPPAWGAIDPQAVVAEVAFLEALLRQPDYPVVLCHNDVQSLNCIVSDDGSACVPRGEVRLIDLEYTAWNYAYFDLANHFCEYGGLDCDYTRFPPVEQQRRFIRAYLAEQIRLAVAEGRVPESLDDENIERWRCRVARFVLASHLLWGIWGLFQARESAGSTFDYVAYAQHRFEAYENVRAELGFGSVHLVRC